MVYCSSYRAFNSGAKRFTLVAFYAIHHEITNSMKQNALPEALTASLSQEIVYISWNPKVHHRFNSVDHCAKC